MQSNRSPDVLLVGFVGGTGGASAVMLNLAVGLIARGISTRIVVPAWDTTAGYAERCRAEGVAVERTRLLMPRSPRALHLADALRFVSRYTAPVVHYHLSDNALDHMFLRAIRWLRPPPPFVSVHSPEDDLPPDSHMARLWARSAAHSLSAVIVVSEAMRARQLRAGVPDHKLRLIYNGVDLERFGSGDAAVARRALGVGPEAPLIVFSSRVAAQKRPLDAVEVFRRLAPEFPDARLVLVGSGPLEQGVAAAVAAGGLGARVHMVGQQSNVADWLAAATVWLLPTETEGFAVAVIEAMAAGCAIVSTRCEGNNEILVDGTNALLADVGDVDVLTGATRRLLSNEALRRELGERGRADSARYSVSRMVTEHLDCYAQGVRTNGLSGPGNTHE